MINWIPDTNRWKLPEPPTWFLNALWDQDTQLVILPSRTRQRYLLARRRDYCMRAPILNKALNALLRHTRGSDGDLLATHNLVMVDTIQGVYGGTWDPGIIAQLRQRDTWAAGGAHEYSKQLEMAEHAAEVKAKANLRDEWEQRAKASWIRVQALTGQRSKLTIPSAEESSSGSTAGLELGVGTPVAG